MSTEVTVLYGAIILGLFQLMLATHFVTLQRGFKWNLSSREQSPPALTAWRDGSIVHLRIFKKPPVLRRRDFGFADPRSQFRRE